MAKAKANILTLETMYLNTTYAANPVFASLKEDGWQFFVVDQQRGRCYYRDKVITLPRWAIYSPMKGYGEYYLCHEMAHTFAKGDEHGAKFMEEFKRICPPEYWHYELSYKPANAAAAGISHKEIERAERLVINVLDLL